MPHKRHAKISRSVIDVNGEDETYRVLQSCPGYRIGVGSRKVAGNTFPCFLEVAIVLVPERPGIDLALLEKDLKLLKELQARGYEINCHDDACISAELAAPPQRLEAEYREIRAMIEAVMVGL
ncbi:MAG TPA: hypothetical protein VLT35_02220 [Methanocella sp.]|nr:hypothetical protein [Methanocella sp.]